MCTDQSALPLGSLSSTPSGLNITGSGTGTGLLYSPPATSQSQTILAPATSLPSVPFVLGPVDLLPLSDRIVGTRSDSTAQVSANALNGLLFNFADCIYEFFGD